MICYQDEKMYGPAPEDVTPEELDERIRKLEMETYGHTFKESESVVSQKIYDVTKKQLVEVS